MKVLLVNSDVAKNRGDRAITEGMIELIRSREEDVLITGLSEESERDAKWFGINFLKMDALSINPIDWLVLANEARRSDLVYWGGGELLQDYTNTISLWYWCAKVLWLSWFNANIYGTFQGVGPTRTALSKRLIRFAVNRTSQFAVRDQESFDKLVRWGVSPQKLISSTDPAVYPTPGELDDNDFKLLHSLGLEPEFLDNFVAIAPRNWFHYQKSGFLPFRWRVRLTGTQVSEQNLRYKQAQTDLLRQAALKNENILLVPMHGMEDIGFCQEIWSGAAKPANVHILDDDKLPPSLLRTLLARARVMVGFRLHSTIIATAGYTPSINCYYVDKGRAYFDQIGQNENAFPIESLLVDGFVAEICDRIEILRDDESSYRRDLKQQISKLREQVERAFEELHH